MISATSEVPLLAMGPQDERCCGWQVRPSADLHWRRWSDEWAVFDASSGQTHQMDFLTGVALLEFDDGLIATPVELLQRVACQLGVEPGLELRDSLSASLERLLMAGLIETGA